MSTILTKIEDPRDNLARASRFELCQIAKSHGIAEITYNGEMQLPDMVRLLREKGIRDAKIEDRPLGDTRPLVLNRQEPVAEVKTEAPVYPVTDIPIGLMNMTELRSACKKRGIKMARTDNLNTLREKLRGENAA